MTGNKKTRKLISLVLAAMMAVSPCENLLAAETGITETAVQQLQTETAAAQQETGSPETAPQETAPEETAAPAQTEIPKQTETAASAPAAQQETPAPETAAQETAASEKPSQTETAAQEQKGSEATQAETAAEEPATAQEETEDRHTLLADNQWQIDDEKKAGKTSDPYVAVSIASQDEFDEGRFAFIQVLPEENAKALGREIDGSIADLGLETDTIYYPLNIAVIDGSGNEIKDHGDLDVKVSMADTDQLKDLYLFHQDADKEWDNVSFSVADDSDLNDGELPYASFRAEDGLGTFLFTSLKEKETDVPETDPIETEENETETEPASETEEKKAETEQTSETDAVLEAGEQTEAVPETKEEPEMTTYTVSAESGEGYSISLEDGKTEYAPGEDVTVYVKADDGYCLNELAAEYDGTTASVDAAEEGKASKGIDLTVTDVTDAVTTVTDMESGKDLQLDEAIPLEETATFKMPRSNVVMRAAVSGIPGVSQIHLHSNSDGDGILTVNYIDNGQIRSMNTAADVTELCYHGQNVGFTNVRAMYFHDAAGQKVWSSFAYCMQPPDVSPTDDKIYTRNISYAGDNIAKAMFYLYRGPAWGATINGVNMKDLINASGFTGSNGKMTKRGYYILTHYIISYMHDPNKAFYKGWPSEGFQVSGSRQALRELVNKVSSLPMPTNPSVAPAVRNSKLAAIGSVSETFTFSGTPGDWAQLTVPANEKLIAAGRTYGAGSVATINSGESFYLIRTDGYTGPENYSLNTRFSTGYYPYKVKVNQAQDLGFAAFEKKGLGFSVKWEGKRYVQVKKASADPAATAGLAEYSFANAAFTLTKPGATYTFVCDGNGNSKAQRMELGTYTVHEASRPTGYHPVDDFQVTIGPGTDTYVITVKDEPKKGKVQILKSAIENDFAKDNPNYSLNGAVFRLSKKGKSYDIPIISSEKSDVMEVAYGTYSVTEIRRPPGYLPNENIPNVTISASQNGAVQIIRVKEPEVRPKLRIVKKSSIPDMTKNNQFYSFEGAEFKLEGYGRTYTFTCGESGIAEVQEVPIGTYTVTETKTPKGYKTNKKIGDCVVKDTEDLQTFTVTDEPITGTMEVIKVVEDEFAELYGDKPMKDAKFSVKYFASTDVEEGTTPTRSWTIRTTETTKDGKTCYTAKLDKAHLVGGSPLYGDNILPLGTIWIQEITPPYHFFMNPAVYKLEIQQDGEGVTYRQWKDNEAGPETGHSIDVEPVEVKEKYHVYAPLTLKKIDSINGNPVQEVSYILTGTSRYTGSVMRTKTSDKDGIVDFGNIDYGEYTLQETGAPDAYIIDKKPYAVTVNIKGEVSVKRDGVEFPVDELGYHVVTNEQYHQVWFQKLSTYGTGIGVVGAKFSLTGRSDYDTDMDLTATSGTDGYTYFEKVEPGTYNLKETQAPDGYQINKTVYAVTVRSDGTFVIDGMKQDEETFGTDGTKIKVYKFLDKPTGGEIKLTKVWSDGLTPEERVKPDAVTMSVSTKMPSRSAYGYALDYNTNGGAYADGSTVNTVYYKGSIVAQGTYKIPTRTGYDLSGWKDSAGNVYALDGAGNSVAPVDTDTQIFAQWTPKTYDLTINPNGGTWNSSGSVQTVKGQYTSSKKIADPSRTGYNFTGWTASGTGTWNSSTKTWTYGIGNGTLKANWACAHPSKTYSEKYTSGWKDKGNGHHYANYHWQYTCDQCGAITSKGDSTRDGGVHYDNDKNGLCDACGKDGRQYHKYTFKYHTSKTSGEKTDTQTFTYNSIRREWMNLNPHNLGMSDDHHWYAGNYKGQPGAKDTGYAQVIYLVPSGWGAGTYYKKDY